jgi:phage I-like protein
VKFGYWSDLASLQFGGDDSTATWIMAMPYGEYDHPVYGKINIDQARAQQFATNVKEGVRGQELDIDYDHKEYGGEAAGWVKDADVRADGLWLLVEWTKRAWTLLKDKAYRYFSPEYNDEWKHPKTGQMHKDVLFGGAITNRPFLKDIVPINLSDLFDHKVPAPPAPTPPAPPAPTTDPSKGGQMDPKILRGILGLAEDATDEQVTAKLAELTKPKPTMDPALTDPASPDDLAKLLRQLSDVDGNPAIKALTDLVGAQRKQLAALALEQKQAKVERRLAELDGDKRFAVPPVVKDQLRDILMRSPDDLGEQVFKAYQETLKLGVIDLTERGWQRRGDDQSPTQKMLTEVDKVMADAHTRGQKMTYAQATAIVSRDNPQLSSEYREDSYIPVEGR